MSKNTFSEVQQYTAETQHTVKVKFLTHIGS